MSNEIRKKINQAIREYNAENKHKDTFAFYPGEIMIQPIKKEPRKYTQEEQKYICSKITNIKWEQISESLRLFWLEWREKQVTK